MEETTIGAVLFDGIEENPYLNELYDAILYNYGRQLFGLTNLPEKEISVPAALRFADILSKSVHTQNEETHKLWAQEIVALLNALHPDDELIQYWTSTTAQREMQSSSASGQGCFRLSTHLQPAGAVGSALTPKEKNCAISITTTQTCGNGCWSCRPCPTR